MKKITAREFKWINKGVIKNLTYNKFYAKGNNSYFLAVSNEDFEVTSSLSLENRDYSFIVSITDKTFFSLNVNNNLSITTSIRGYKSNTNVDSKYLKDRDTLNVKLKRENESFSFFINDILISSATLPASKDAVSFGFYFNNKEFTQVSNFSYIKK